MTVLRIFMMILIEWYPKIILIFEIVYTISLGSKDAENVDFGIKIVASIQNIYILCPNLVALFRSLDFIKSNL
jgi:hypothetical protein